MKSITQLGRKMQQLLQKRANELAQETGFSQRERELTGSSFVVGLVSAWQADSQVSLAGLSQAVGNAGTPISRQSLAQRFTPEAVELMYAMLQESVQVTVNKIPVQQGLLARFSGVELTDSSIVTLPKELHEVWRGSGGSGIQASIAQAKISVRWNMSTGDVSVLDISDGKQHDRNTLAHTATVMAGSLQIKDLGYFKLDDFEVIAQQGAYWLSRYKVGTYVMNTEGEILDLVQILPKQMKKRLDIAVVVGKTKRLPARLVAERVPDEVVQQRHERLHEIAAKKQHTVSEQSLILAAWTIYLTNVPAHLLSSHEVFVMAQYRWQIELLFKQWKSDLGIDKWRTNNPNRILCELYAKLIAAVVTQWFLVLAKWHDPRRSLRQAMPTIRGLAWQWANSLGSLNMLKHALNSLFRALLCCHLDFSKNNPRTFQKLEAHHA